MTRMRERAISLQREMIEVRPPRENDWCCSICLEDVAKSPALHTRCGHTFHMACFTKYRRHLCNETYGVEDVVDAVDVVEPLLSASTSEASSPSASEDESDDNSASAHEPRLRFVTSPPLTGLAPRGVGLRGLLAAATVLQQQPPRPADTLVSRPPMFTQLLEPEQRIISRRFFERENYIDLDDPSLAPDVTSSPQSPDSVISAMELASILQTSEPVWTRLATEMRNLSSSSLGTEQQVYNTIHHRSRMAHLAHEKLGMRCPMCRTSLLVSA